MNYVAKTIYSSRGMLTLCVFESELPSTRGEDLQAKCLLELYGLKVSLSPSVLSDFCYYVTLFEL